MSCLNVRNNETSEITLLSTLTRDCEEVHESPGKIILLTLIVLGGGQFTPCLSKTSITKISLRKPQKDFFLWPGH